MAELFIDEPLTPSPVTVSLRLRPPNDLERARRSTDCCTVGGPDGAGGGGDGAGRTSLHVESPSEGEFDFAYDRVYGEDAGQSSVYDGSVSHLPSQLLEGFDCALVAYGQTGSGKTHTMMGAKGSETPSRRSSGGSGARLGDSERSGMVQRLVGDVFRLMRESPPTVEYTVRCSFVEIYLEKVLDLLNPTNRSVQVTSPEDSDDGAFEGDVELEGASEACCFDKNDVISLLVRGNASRTVSSTKMNSDSSRSHAVFTMKVEQRDSGTGITKASRITLLDLAGSELGARELATDDAVDDEARMINKSLSVLARCVSTVSSNQRGGPDRVITHEVPYRLSKLTHVLRDAFGGNCRTAIILTASPASYNIGESIRTMKFGHVARTVTNHVKPRVEMCPTDYRKLLQDSHARQSELVTLVNQLSAECFQLKQDAMQGKFQEKDYGGPLWETIENILVNGATPAARKHSGVNEPAAVAKIKEDLNKTKEELRTCQAARVGLENALSERQSEVALLQTQNDNDTKEKKKYSREAVSMRNEIRLLTQRKQEVEHNLRTSQFREYEATVFLRQFRRFYRRLLRNKAAQGTGRTGDVIERVPGVPDLNDLIDVDTLLLEAGLIEESELRDDTATGAYRPSAQALERSGRSSDAAARSGGQPSDATPAGKLTAMRERELERDLLKATERCIELQVALNEERSNVEILTNRSGNVNKKKYAQESIQLKQQLEKKTHDLQAIIWKMNELHLINKTYNEKMSNREQHVTYLEENLVELQNTNRTMILERRDVEDALREELDSLKVLVDAMTVPLWQLGECGITGRALASRIRMPVNVGGGSADEGDGNDETSHLDSMDESYVEEDESDDDDDEEEMEDGQGRAASDGAILGASRPVVPTAEVSTQTAVAADEKSTMTDFAPDTAGGGRSRHAAAGDYSSSTTTTSSAAATENERGNNNGSGPAAKVSYRGGALPGTQPRRFVPKYGLMIRPGVLKETRPKQ